MNWNRIWIPPGKGEIVRAWHLGSIEQFAVQIGDTLTVVDRETMLDIIERTGVWTLNTDG